MMAGVEIRAPYIAAGIDDTHTSFVIERWC
jgi:hypothetical protein